MLLLKNKIAKNASWIIGVKVFQSLVSFIIGMLTARYLGPSNFGLVNYAASVVAFVVPIMQLGIANIIVQELVQNPDEEGKIMGTGLVLNFISSFLCIVGVFVFSLITNASEKETVIVTVLYSILLVFQSAEALSYWFQAHLLSKYSSIVSFVAYFVTAVYKACLLVFGKNVYWFAVSNAIDYLLIAIGLLICYKCIGGQRFSFSKETGKRLLHRGKHYIVSSMMVTIFAQTDRIMLKHMMDNSAVGFYSASVTCAGVVAFVFAAIIDSYRPVIFEYKKTSEENYEKSLCRLYCIITYGALFVSLGITIFAKTIIEIVYGSEYEPAISALRIICWYTTFAYYGSIRNIWILAEEKQKYLWIINLSGAAANVVLNYFFIPIWGVNGAAFASLITQFFTNVAIGWIMRPIRYNNRLMMKGLNPALIIQLIK